MLLLFARIVLVLPTLLGREGVTLVLAGSVWIRSRPARSADHAGGGDSALVS
jgi:hypothetical protein